MEPLPLPEFSDKAVHQRRDILLSLPQRRNIQLEHIEPVVQILPEFSRTHQIFQIFVGGCDDPDVDGDDPAVTQPHDLTLLEDRKVEGILISVAVKGKNTQYYRDLISRGIPLVFFNRTDNSVDTSSVTIDDYKWSFFAAEHLIYTRRKLGKEKPEIMHFMGPANIDLSNIRCRGYADAVAKHHLSSEAYLTVPVKDITREEGYRRMSLLIENGPIPDGLFCFNDHLALGAMKALREHGICVPESVSVMGFSESQSALVSVPALSSVAQPLEEIGKTAAGLLLEKIENPDSPSKKVVLNAVLNIRGSSDPSKSM